MRKKFPIHARSSRCLVRGIIRGSRHRESFKFISDLRHAFGLLPVKAFDDVIEIPLFARPRFLAPCATVIHLGSFLAPLFAIFFLFPFFPFPSLLFIFSIFHDMEEIQRSVIINNRKERDSGATRGKVIDWRVQTEDITYVVFPRG